jgi:transcriptional regulator with XRE-family HTH domain
MEEETLEQILEAAAVYRSLSNDITDSWRKVLKWKNISQAELSRRTGISEKSIGYIITGKKNASIDSIVFMCIGANLPSEISEHMLYLSGYRLTLSDEENAIFSYILRNMYTKSLPEIREFLHEIGSDFYLKLPAYTGSM